MSFGTSELGSSDAELGSIELAGLSSGTSPLVQSVSQTLAFTQTVAPHFVRLRALSQTLSFTSTATYTDTTLHETLSQTLAFTQTISTHFTTRNISVVQILPFVQSIGLSQNVTYHVTQTLAFADRISREIPRSILQFLNLTDSSTSGKEHDASDLLAFTQTVSVSTALSQYITQTLAFTDIANRSQNLSVTDTFAITDQALVDFTYQQVCDQGTLGDTALGDMTLGTDCGSGAYDSDSDTLIFSETFNFQKIYHRSVSDHLVFNDGAHLGNWLRVIKIQDTLNFYNGYYPKAVPGTNGTTISIPVAIGTIVRPLLTMVSSYGAIVLPPASFDDSAGTNNKVKILRTMTRKAFVYVKSSDRIKLSYEFFLEKSKALELRRFCIANTDTVVTLTNWKGEIYIGKLANNPVEFTSQGRLALAFESVIVAIEFQGVKVSG